MTNATMDDLANLLDKKRTLEEEIKKEAKEVFANSSKEIFEKYGDKVGLFGWAQYTPYFNDGDPCEFSVHELFIYSPEEVADDSYDVSYYESGDAFNSYSGKLSKTVYKDRKTGKTSHYSFQVGKDYTVIPNPDYDPSYGDPKKEIETLFDLLDEDTLLSLFGDHCVVLVTANGVEVEYHEHD